MNVFEFMLTMGFWQWLGFISIVGTISGSFAHGVGNIRLWTVRNVKSKDFYDKRKSKTGMNGHIYNKEEDTK